MFLPLSRAVKLGLWCLHYCEDWGSGPALWDKDAVLAKDVRCGVWCVAAVS